jgi:hypothetical protein
MNHNYRAEKWKFEFTVPVTADVLADREFYARVQEFAPNHPDVFPGDTLHLTYEMTAEYLGGVHRKIVALQHLLLDPRVTHARVETKRLVGEMRGSLLDLLRQMEDLEGKL